MSLMTICACQASSRELFPAALYRHIKVVVFTTLRFPHNVQHRVALEKPSMDYRVCSHTDAGCGHCFRSCAICSSQAFHGYRLHSNSDGRGHLSVVPSERIQKSEGSQR